MVRRVQSCINLDAENKDYLGSKPEGASEFINRLVKRYRESEEARKAIGNLEPVDTKEAMEEIIKMTKKEQEEAEVKIRAFFVDRPDIIYGIIKGPPPTSKQFQRIKDQLEWSKYEIRTDCDTIKRIIRDIKKTFNVREYEQTRSRL
jgi:hypothetical protein